jgi:hypothetical protein
MEVEHGLVNNGQYVVVVSNLKSLVVVVGMYSLYLAVHQQVGIFTAYAKAGVELWDLS